MTAERNVVQATVTTEQLKRVMHQCIDSDITRSDLVMNSVNCFLKEPDKTLGFFKDVLGKKAQGKCFTK